MRKPLRIRRIGLAERVRRCDEAGATTAEYAVCTGAAVGFAGLLFKLLTSGAGQAFLEGIWSKMSGMLPF